MEVPRFIPSVSPLLCCIYSPLAFEPSLRTATSHPYWIVCCVDFGNGFHHSHSSLYFLISAQNDPFAIHIPSANTPSVIAPPVTDRLASDISLVRDHMRSRRGGTRGGSSHPPIEHATSSPSHELHHPPTLGEGRYPNTRHGRDRACSLGFAHGEFSVHSENFPPPLQSAPHSAQFKFCNSLNRLAITTTISIFFSKENTQTVSQVDNS